MIGHLPMQPFEQHWQFFTKQLALSIDSSYSGNDVAINLRHRTPNGVAKGFGLTRFNQIVVLKQKEVTSLLP